MNIKFCVTATALFVSLFWMSCENFILGPDAQNTPTNNFEILWNEYDHYYPSFNVKHINWDSLYTVYRPMVMDQTSEKQLWDIVSEMLSHFNDAHVYMYNRDRSDYYSSSTHQIGHRNEFSLSLVKTKYLEGRYWTAGDGNLTAGKLDGDSIGYLYIGSFDGYGWAEDIDVIISELYNTKAMIVDIRDNHGGLNSVFAYIAAAFINKPITYSKEIARNGPNHNDFTQPIYQTVIPRPYTVHYTKQIILLTNRISVSASESFALMFKQLPYSKQIGDTTAGNLGSWYRVFQLPNGWTYYMPTSLELTLDGRSLENIGVAPDIYRRNSREEIYDGYDRQLEYAIEYLSNL